MHDSGYFEPHINSYCGLGDSYSRGFENGTTNKEKVTCKRCKKSIKIMITIDDIKTTPPEDTRTNACGVAKDVKKISVVNNALKTG